MKQTLKEAVAEYIENHVSRNENASFSAAFRAGAEWQLKQSPWISVEEKLPAEQELVLCRMLSNGAIVSGYIYLKSCKPRVATNADFEFEDYGDYEPDIWMPIPSFDEILEANKDVLERIKEKGD